MVEAGTDCCVKNFGAKFRHVVESEKSGRLNGAVDEDLFLEEWLGFEAVDERLDDTVVSAHVAT